MSINLRKLLCIGRGHEWRPLISSSAIVACKRCGKPYIDTEMT